jgi:hypothetical protein
VFLLFLRAYRELLLFDAYLRRDFASLHDMVRKCPTASPKPSVQDPERICRAIDVACIWYPKQVLCLQRSAATVCLLRNYGVPAQMVIGTQTLPFKSHAWVELDGRVVNDRPYVRDIYSQLDRC